MRLKMFVSLTTGWLLFGPSSLWAWSAYGGGPGGGQYAPLDQINVDNVEDLEVAWEYRTGDVSTGDERADPTAFEANPIFANDKLYLCTAFGRVMALEPDTGNLAWMFDPQQKLAGSLFGLHLCRGVAYWQDESSPTNSSCAKRIFLGTVDARVFAVDADTGRVCEDFGDEGEIRLDEFDYVNPGTVGISSPPAVIGDRIVVGGVISSYSAVKTPNGIVRAFDARSGEEVWHWNPVPEHLRTRVGGINVWPPMSVDKERGLVFLPTGSATVDPYGVHRTDKLPYANALVAMDAMTGEPLWHFQILRHDLWDYDLPAQPIVVDITRYGKRIEAVIQFTKTGLMFAFHREDGRPVFPIDERPVPASDIPGEASAPTQPHPLVPIPLTRTELVPDDAWGITFWDRGRCRKEIASLRSEGLHTPPSVQGTVQLPSGYGGVNWGNAAYHPGKNWVIVGATQVANVSVLIPRGESGPLSIKDHSNFDVGGPLEDTPYQYKSRPILSPFGAPCTPPPWGTMTAIDMDTGQFVWQVPFGRVPKGLFRTPQSWGSPLIGGPIATAGGLIFAGAALDHYFRALDLESGKLLWESNKLPAPASATPMSYMYKGRQYIVVAAGGNAVAGTELSDAVIAYALPLND